MEAHGTEASSWGFSGLADRMLATITTNRVTRVTHRIEKMKQGLSLQETFFFLFMKA